MELDVVMLTDFYVAIQNAQILISVIFQLNFPQQIIFVIKHNYKLMQG